MGIIDTGFDPGEHTIVSNASHTTTLLAPIPGLSPSRTFPLSGAGPGTGFVNSLFDLPCHPLLSPRSPLCA